MPGGDAYLEHPGPDLAQLGYVLPCPTERETAVARLQNKFFSETIRILVGLLSCARDQGTSPFPAHALVLGLSGSSAAISAPGFQAPEALQARRHLRHQNAKCCKYSQGFSGTGPSSPGCWSAGGPGTSVLRGLILANTVGLVHSSSSEALPTSHCGQDLQR